MPAPRKSKRLAFWLILVAGQLALALLLTEFVLPRFVPVSNLVYRRWGNRPDTFYPHFPLKYVTPQKESVYFRSNALGFKDVDHSPAKPFATQRVLFLGDSYIESVAVPVGAQASQVLEKRAGEQGLKMEVIAMGMSGYGQAQHLSTYETVGKLFQPDWVVTFFCANDLWNNTYAPDYRLEKGSLILQLDPRPLPETRMSRFKKLTVQRTEIYHIYRAFRRYGMLLLTPAQEKQAAQTAAQGVTPKATRASETPAQKLDRVVGPPEQRALFHALLGAIKERVEKRDGAKLLNVIVSTDVRSDNPDFDYYMKWVEAAYAQHAIPTLNLNTEFRSRFKATGQRPHEDHDAHWNIRGQQWVAERLLREISVKRP